MRYFVGYYFTVSGAIALGIFISSNSTRYLFVTDLILQHPVNNLVVVKILKQMLCVVT